MNEKKIIWLTFACNICQSDPIAMIPKLDVSCQVADFQI